ncbi:hypothetical protein M406DRAFT_93266 [Cryphonectria parasitica EP155]|uniref:Vacuolar protein sorting-associated protein TDA6 n=1 Tax=Cryphonectria parasitica (strain ATCC 38755 / EP155) TaxID=660469 RepID=A0A9P5CMI9_CRYP1|nr:uncharacterized protein M406DRAFT_93266 [Cryphonectria parasitica EP155]KAF3762935.1 hypothetical protein M406DRAFT_93266 [Cryphonectria parasitica EP155]
MYHLRRATVAVAIIASLVFITWFVPKILIPNPPSPEDQKRDKAWVNSSPYWLDRQACKWFSVCGIHHMRWDDPVKPRGPAIPVSELGELELKKRRSLQGRRDVSSASWEDLGTRARPVQERGQTLDDVPEYVLRNAPLVHLYSGESFWPSDISEHIRHMTPFVNKEPLNTTEPLSLANLYDLSTIPDMVYLTSREDVEQRPEWLSSHVGRPEPFDEDDDETIDPAGDHNAEQPNAPYTEGTTWFDVDKDHPLRRISDPREQRSFEPSEMLSKHMRRAVLSGDHSQKPFPPPPTTPGHKPDASGYSAAPAVLVLVDKGSGILDAFWFFFYSYNLGQTVLDMRFGNHVGDWEHCMVRFENSEPRAMFLSEHEGGQAYAWGALEKKRMNITTTTNSATGEGTTEIVERPVIYSAVGSHAMYAFPGPHAYVLPFQMLKDVTDRGPLWDPSLNKRGEVVQPTSLVPASSNPDAPTSWFHFDGPWGDELYGLGDERQWRLFGQYHYVTGPMGPKFKRLGREKVCQKDKCRLLYSIEEGKKSSWHD